MEKSISIRVNEFRQGLEKVINRSGLCPAVMDGILQNYLLQVKEAAARQILEESRAYSQAQEQEAREKEEEHGNLPG